MRITTIIVKRGWSDGRKPTKELQTSCVYLPLSGICDVPVFPAWSSSNPRILDVQPEPFCTTCSIIAVILAAVAGVMTWRCGCRSSGLSCVPIRSTAWGGAYLPPLATTLIAASIWTMLTSMPCPNEDVANCESCILATDGGAMKFSPATSIPLGCVRPNACR